MAGEVMVQDPKTATGNRHSSAEEKKREVGEVAFDPSSCEAIDGGAMDRSSQIHSLEYLWTFWYDHPSTKSTHLLLSKSSGEDNMGQREETLGASTFPLLRHSLPKGLYNNIKHPSKLPTGADFHCFKNGIEPKWEDPICENGGKWTVTCPKGKVDAWWLYTLLAMIGEHFDHGDEICGAVVNIRAKQEKISIWTKNGSDKAAQTSIGKQWKEALDYNETIGYILHDHAKQYDRSAKSVHQV